ncbi:metal-dependent hydrolase family protein [Sphingomonas turrisvirgatae]|uniref:Xaa-Pro dipeptidase n=1 Tax=Sphingomonas turrisvirgatae TaxID=1888892 RepID=A0A1E3LW07_9SPHN|nr:amidohydrolase family protein [Sphingomonas turrisvirgatae]ODP37904.1 Xaa-Pro dipeptidase [Sphingomonas turrisvirgatae]
MRRFTAIAAVLLAATPLSAQTAAPAAAAPTVTYIHAGALLARPGEAARGASTIIVRDGKIAEVRDGHVAPEGGAELVDLKDRFVLPGLIDMHVHLWGIGGDPLNDRLTALNRDDADDMMWAVGNARVTLDAGFTTVRDLGGNARGMRALREEVERGVIAGPTIVNVGTAISVTGGHADPSNGLSETFADAMHQHQINTCDGPDDCRRAVRQQIALGAQAIKYMSTGGVLSNVSGGLGRAMTDEEMRAIIDTAHGLGRRVATHSHGVAGTKAAVAAGVDTVDHGSFLDDEAIKAMKAKGTWLVPTMLAPQAAVEFARKGLLPPAVLPKAEEAAAAAFASHSKAIAAGVKVAFGTDTGVSKHGDNAREFALMVKAGMTPAQAIKAATVSAAEALGRSATIGSIEPGKDADIIAVSGSPLEDVTRLERVDFVMRRGAVHKAGGKR